MPSRERGLSLPTGAAPRLGCTQRKGSAWIRSLLLSGPQLPTPALPTSLFLPAHLTVSLAAFLFGVTRFSWNSLWVTESGVFLSGRYQANTCTCPGSSGGLALLIPRSSLGALALVSPAAEIPGVYSEPTEALVSFPSPLTSSGIYPQWKPESLLNSKLWRLVEKSLSLSKVGVGQSQYFLPPAGVQPQPFSCTKALAQPGPQAPSPSFPS